MSMLSSSETLTLTASVAEALVSIAYLFLIIVISTSRLSVLNTSFYVIFAVTGVSAILNDVVIIALRMINQVFVLGPEFGNSVFIAGFNDEIGSASNYLTYFSHIFVFAHSAQKAMQIINRFTALLFPVRYDEIWSSRRICVAMTMSYVFPAILFSFIIINQEAKYTDIGGGRLKYSGMGKTTQEISKCIIAAVHVLFVIVTLPMNVLLLLRMKRLRKENVILFNKERIYLYYVLIITVAYLFAGAHQYAYPNAITTFIPPIALVLMSKQVRNAIRLFVGRKHSESSIVDSASNFHNVTTVNVM